MHRPVSPRYTLTLDWKLSALRHPQDWRKELATLPLIEHACFAQGSIALMRVPAEVFARTQGQPLEAIGGLVASVVEGDSRLSTRRANATWLALRECIWPDRTDAQLTNAQCMDVTQLFVHHLMGAAAFLTVDAMLLACSAGLAAAFDIRVLTPEGAWLELQQMGVRHPDDTEIAAMFSTWEYDLRALGVNVVVPRNDEATRVVPSAGRGRFVDRDPFPMRDVRRPVGASGT